MGAQPEHQSDLSDRVAYIARDRTPVEPSTQPGGVVGSRLAVLRTRRGMAMAFGLGLLVLLLVLLATRPWSGASTPALPAAGSQVSIPLVSVISPELKAVTSTVSFTGSIHARNDMPIGPEGEGGRIRQVFVEAGDTVKRGQLLAKLDDSVIRPQVNRLAAALEEARARAALAEAEYARAQGVEAAGALSAEEIERRRSAAVTAAAQVKVAAAQLAESEALLKRTEIRAPANGVVLTRNAEVGQTARPGDALFRLAQDGEVEMRARVAEQEMPLLKVGQKANVRLTGVTEPFEGKVWLLGAVIDPETRLGEIRIALQSDPLLRPGSFARGEVIVNQAQRSVLPQTAVLTDERGTYVYIVNDENIVERRDVRIIGTISEGIVIGSGLSGDERVVATAGGFLREGERVNVAPAKAA